MAKSLKELKEAATEKKSEELTHYRLAHRLCEECGKFAEYFMRISFECAEQPELTSLDFFMPGVITHTWCKEHVPPEHVVAGVITLSLRPEKTK